MSKIFDLNLKEKLNPIVSLNQDYEFSLMCMHYNQVPNVFSILHDIYSEKFWKYIKEKFKVTDENINIKTDLSIDEKNREHKLHHYTIYIKEYDIFLNFFDEEKNFDDSDYMEMVEESEKLNKITNLRIFYISDKVRFVVEQLIPEIKELIHIPTIKNQFFIISINNNTGGFELRGTYIRKTDIDLELNYGKGFSKKHEKIISTLKDNSTGLYLLHGDSGTGKTTYIRKIISELSDEKTFIYLPSYLMNEIANPDLISFISNYKNSVLILEDAENVLTSSNSERTQAVSNILNISDGLLNDAVNIQILATFNVSKKIIDDALTRPGRLRLKHEFKKLSAEEANKLCEKMGINKKFKKDVSLAEIFNTSSTNLVEEETNKKIGFN